jgi:hypothetical protein
MVDLTGETAVLADTGETFRAVAAARGVAVEQALNPKESGNKASGATAKRGRIQ